MNQLIQATWSWISQNSQALSVLVSLGTLFVWLFYAQLLLAGFKRQRQARILINQGWGRAVNSVCLISNMSHEPIYIQCVMIGLRTASGEYRSSVTDLNDDASYSENSSLENITRQGPLLSGSYMNLGTFLTLIRQASKKHGLSCNDDPISSIGLENVTITVISSYGPEGGAIGTQREFTIGGDDGGQLVPASIDSRRLVNRRARRKMRRWLEEAA